jgi:hypothetical protein
MWQGVTYKWKIEIANRKDLCRGNKFMNKETGKFEKNPFMSHGKALAMAQSIDWWKCRTQNASESQKAREHHHMPTLKKKEDGTGGRRAGAKGRGHFNDIDRAEEMCRQNRVG